MILVEETDVLDPVAEASAGSGWADETGAVQFNTEPPRAATFDPPLPGDSP